MTALWHRLRGHKVKPFYLHVPPRARRHMRRLMEEMCAMGFPHYGVVRLMELSSFGYIRHGSYCKKCRKRV